MISIGELLASWALLALVAGCGWAIVFNLRRGEGVKETKTFKAGAAVLDLLNYVEGSLVELTGDSAPTLATKVRITVETVKADDLAIDAVLTELSLETAKEHVEKFIEYRIERRKRITSVKALRRLLLPFLAKPGVLRASVNESISQGWTGLFVREEGNGSASRDFVKTKGGPSGGTW